MPRDYFGNEISPEDYDTQQNMLGSVTGLERRNLPDDPNATNQLDHLTQMYYNGQHVEAAELAERYGIKDQLNAKIRTTEEASQRPNNLRNVTRDAWDIFTHSPLPIAVGFGVAGALAGGGAAAGAGNIGPGLGPSAAAAPPVGGLMAPGAGVLTTAPASTYMPNAIATGLANSAAAAPLAAGAGVLSAPAATAAASGGLMTGATGAAALPPGGGVMAAAPKAPIWSGASGASNVLPPTKTFRPVLDFFTGNKDIIGSVIAGLGQGMVAGAEADAERDLLNQRHELTSSNYRGTDPGRTYRGLMPGTSTQTPAMRYDRNDFGGWNFQYDPRTQRVIRVPIEPVRSP